jgi:REP element-mobilizing transposase RayT
MTFPSRNDPSHLYFVTATLVGWKQLFRETGYATIPLDCLDWLQRKKRILLFAFVLMPSHLHAIIKPENEAIGTALHSFGSFTAHRILHRLQAQEKTVLLGGFHLGRRDRRHTHSIWQDIQAKNIYSTGFLWQKLEYIHQNPIARDWALAMDRADYLYSSAGYYDYGRRPIIEITDINAWLASSPSPGTAKGAS